MQDRGKTYFRTLGTFRVTNPDGDDCTPRAVKACGLLAILLDAPEYTRPRPFLQDKLWSDRAQAQGAASLRQTLTEIRAALGDARDIIVTDRRGVTLDAGKIATDWKDPQEIVRAAAEKRTFLEDIDIRDEEFEDWLRDCRLRAEEIAEAAPATPAGLDLPTPEMPRMPARPQVVLASQPAPGSLGLGDMILRSVSRGLSERGAIDVYWAPHAPSDGGRRFSLEAREVAVGGKTIVQIEMSDPATGVIKWQIAETLETSPGADWENMVARIVSRGVDRTFETLSQSGLSTQVADYDTVFFRTIYRAFQTRALEYDELRQHLSDCFDRDPRGIYLAWRGFLACFAMGERRTDDIETVRHEARDLMRRALEMEPHNSLVLALTSHIHSFVLGEYAAAHEFAERSVRLERNNVLGWTFLGTAKVFLDDTAEGYRCLLHAQKISGEGPYRHMVDFFTAMAATLNGDTRAGIPLAQTSLSMAPDFLPSLRYLLAAQIYDKDFAAAEATYRRLRVLEPDFELRFFAEPDYPVPALRKVGLLDLKTLSKLDFDK